MQSEFQQFWISIMSPTGGTTELLVWTQTLFQMSTAALASLEKRSETGPSLDLELRASI